MHAGTVNYLRLRADWAMDSIKFCTRGGSCIETGGDGGKEREWHLHDEAIVALRWWSGGYADSIVGVEATLTNGAKLFYGQTTKAAPQYKTAPPGKALVGFELRAHRPPQFLFAVEALEHLRPLWG
jgi:hypothetical protein